MHTTFATQYHPSQTHSTMQFQKVYQWQSCSHCEHSLCPSSAHCEHSCRVSSAYCRQVAIMLLAQLTHSVNTLVAHCRQTVVVFSPNFAHSTKNIGTLKLQGASICFQVPGITSALARFFLVRFSPHLRQSDTVRGR